MKTAVILLGHGSQADGGNHALAEVAVLVKERGGITVLPAYLQFCKPSLTDAVETAVRDGAEEVTVVPYFLYLGNHVARDIPEELDRLRAAHPDVKITMTNHLGAHPKLAEIVIERIRGK